MRSRSLTAEQQAVVESTEKTLKINAVAGATPDLGDECRQDRSMCLTYLIQRLIPHLGVAASRAGVERSITGDRGVQRNAG